MIKEDIHMKKLQKMRRTAKIAFLLVMIAVGAFFTLRMTHNQAMGITETAQAMQEMEGMNMGTNETGQAMAMLTPQKKQLIGVKIAQVQEKEAEKVIRAVGRVAYDERKLAQINLRIDGWIQDLFVNFTGQEVRKGEPLFTLYSPDLLSTQQEYLLAKRSQEKLAASPIADVRETGETLVSSARERLLLWEITEKQIQELEKRGTPQTYMTIHAPINGIVTKREGTRGMRVTPGMTLYEIADISTVWVFADVYEYELSYIKTGQEADIMVDAYPGEQFRGKVTFIDPFLNPQTRTVRVRLELPNPGFKLKPEMFAQVELKSPVGKGLVIPESAILDSGLRQIVFIDKGMEMYAPREIKARRLDGDYLVLEGLTAGERIVTSANFLIDAESKLMASANMMGALGMAGVKMEQAQMGEMDMDMKGMEGMKGEKAPTGPQTKKAGDLTLTLSTEPAPPKEGENLLRLKVVDASGKSIENAKVVFSYTMPMPGMKAVKAPASFKNGQYEGKAKFGMAGTWEVTAIVTSPGKPEVQEKFTLEAGGGEMEGMEGMPGM
ncbi:efflux RND transporter periplasmic adaptor subunit [Nitrospiraceae bacterium HYJII51-Mn-bac16s-1-B09]|uniref:Efflux RND transporter periplasmic adaptor subunit n=2 Tax=Candidatus Manganitrophus noduliformans TaxID=2606439 RepID=A0A7X6DU34_9BACT|nr:efflux RND transporter periplasmic adaptor subunit [Candidatus Manganitrophus noduliformans]